MPKSSMSGISVPEEIQKIISALIKKEHQYAVFEFTDLGLVDDKKVLGWTTVAVGDRFEGSKHATIESDELRAHYSKFVEDHVNTKAALFIMYDFTVARIENVKTKIVGIQWCPDDLDVKRRMGYASSVEELKKECGPTKVLVQNELSEIDYDSILKELGAKV